VAACVINRSNTQQYVVTFTLRLFDPCPQYVNATVGVDDTASYFCHNLSPGASDYFLLHLSGGD
jgi:hypothetical protein